MKTSEILIEQLEKWYSGRNENLIKKVIELQSRIDSDALHDKDVSYSGSSLYSITGYSATVHYWNGEYYYSSTNKEDYYSGKHVKTLSQLKKLFLSELNAGLFTRNRFVSNFINFIN